MGAREHERGGKRTVNVRVVFAIDKRWTKEIGIGHFVKKRETACDECMAFEQ